jgi:glycosyltransferase involved in cell wall biosynthesis
MHQENKINLSIIIPVFNEEQYLNKLFLDLKKYFNQEDIEVIVVNDGQ